MHLAPELPDHVRDCMRDAIMLRVLVIASALLTFAAGLSLGPPAATSQPPSIAIRMQRYNRQGKHRQALKLFSSWRKNASEVEQQPAEVAAWIEAITAHSRMGQGESALQCFQGMQETGLKPSVVAYSAAIRACANRQLWPVALSLLDDLRADGLHPDTVACNAALVACDRAGQLEEAELLLRSMRDDGPQPDAISLNTVVSTAARRGNWQRALALLSEMEAEAEAGGSGRVRPDVYTYTAAISACERGGQPTAALETFARMQSAGVEPTTAAYNAAIRAAATRELWPVSLSLLEDMRADGVPLDLVSYNTALTACERGAELSEAVLLLEELEERWRDEADGEADGGLRPDAITFHTALAVAKRASYVGGAGADAARFAVRLVRTMQRPPLNLTPSVIGITGAMAACNGAAYWRASAAIFGRMERSGIEPDVVALREALVTCAGGGYWRLALQLLTRVERLAAASPSVASPSADAADGRRGRGRGRGRGARGSAGARGRGRGRGRGSSRGSSAGADAATFARSAEPLELGARACQLGGQQELADRLSAAARVRRTAS